MPKHIKDETRLRVAGLPRQAPLTFDVSPGDDVRKRIAAELGLTELRKFRLKGAIRAEGREDWRLDGTLGATVVQPCVVTLKPVTTRIDEAVSRLFMRDWTGPASEGTEIEMPEDDSPEPLGETIDLVQVMTEALALALPVYPRADDAEIGDRSFPAPGAAPVAESESKPFSVLSEFRKKLENDD